MTQVLVVDPDAELGIGFRAALERDGYDVEWRAEARTLELVGDADLCVATLAAARQLGSRLPTLIRGPVLVLGAEPPAPAEMGGFRLGYDEYLRWPCRTAALHGRVDELAARALRCESPRLRPRLVHLTGCTVDPADGVVMRDGHVLQLSGREHAMLVALLRRDGRVARREDLGREVWGTRNGRTVGRSLDNCIVSLRRKLERDPASPRHLLTVWGSGYRLLLSGAASSIDPAQAYG